MFQHCSPIFFQSRLVAGLTAALLMTAPSARADQSCSAEEGQALIEEGRYDAAMREFSCVIDAAPTEVEGYRGRIEAQLLLGEYADAVRDYTRVTAMVLPLHPEAIGAIYDGYADRLADDPTDVRALTGASFARWWYFDYGPAIHLLNRLLAQAPDDLYGTLFRGSSRLLHGSTPSKGVVDLERAIELAPTKADVRFIVADAYTYGQSDPARAFAEASLALDWGLDTPRVHAILASAYNAFGDFAAGAEHIERHFELVTTEQVVTAPLAVATSVALDLVPGRTYEIPVAAVAGGVISIVTGSPSHEIWDSIVLLVAPDGAPVLSSDDDVFYFAAFDWVAEETGTYRLLVSSFESVSTGGLVVTRD